MRDKCECGDGTSVKEESQSQVELWAWNHFDFVEVGTSNYHTLVQAVAGHPEAKPDADWYLDLDKDPAEVRGLAVDMKREYLDQLPSLPGVVKVCAAVSERGCDRNKKMRHVPLRDVEHWERVFATSGNWLAYRQVRLARGCSTLGTHHTLENELRKIGLLHLVRKQVVQVCSLRELFFWHRVWSVGVLALDCEGYDCAILRGLIEAGDNWDIWFPQVIIFETNGMNDEVFGQGTESRAVEELCRRGYVVWYGGGWRDTGKRDTVLWRLPWSERQGLKVGEGPGNLGGENASQ